jgi:hypothetical protein
MTGEPCGWECGDLSQGGMPERRRVDSRLLRQFAILAHASVGFIMQSKVQNDCQPKDISRE